MAWNGPSGTYSHCWMSRALQSLRMHEAEDHLFGLLLGQHLADRRRLADHDAHFEFEIEPLARPEARHVRRRRLQLPARPAHLGAADHDGRGAAVVADRHMQPVRLQRIVLAAEHDADIGGVLLRRIEIGVAGDRDRQMQFDVRHRHQRALAQFVIVAQFRMIVAQQFADPRPRLRPDFRSQRHERVERRRGEHAELADIEPAVLLELPEIEHVIADRDADARGEAVPGGEHAVGQILDREIGGGIDGDEGAEGGIVGMGHGVVLSVRRHLHSCVMVRDATAGRRPGIQTSRSRRWTPGSRFDAPRQ